MCFLDERKHSTGKADTVLEGKHSTEKVNTVLEGKHFTEKVTQCWKINTAG